MATTHGSSATTTFVLVVVVAVIISTTGFVEIEASSTCPSMFKDCDDDPSNGCETFIGGDEDNCGACGSPCSNHSAPLFGVIQVFCSSAICQYICDDNMGNCDHDLSNGCETDLKSDPNNCGACGIVCDNCTSTLVPDSRSNIVPICHTSAAGDPLRPPIVQFVIFGCHAILLALSLPRISWF